MGRLPEPSCAFPPSPLPPRALRLPAGGAAESNLASGGHACIIVRCHQGAAQDLGCLRSWRHRWRATAWRALPPDWQACLAGWKYQFT